jgi:hypothetical protein
VHGTGVYSARVGPKGPVLERFLDIKKKKKNWKGLDPFVLFCILTLNLLEEYFGSKVHYHQLL